MKIFPRSLFGRTVLLFSIMMLLNYLSSIIIYFVFFTRPFAEITAYNFYQKVDVIQSALKKIPPAQQSEYLDDLLSNGTIILNKNKSIPPGYIAENIYQEIVRDEIMQRLSPRVQGVKFQMKDDPQIIWAFIAIQEQNHWLGIPMKKLRGAFPWNLLTQLLLVIILTLIAAFIIARKVKKPLSQFEHAATKLGKGESPDLLPETGLTELQAMSKTFNNMAQDVERLAEDRNLLLAGVSHDLRTPLARLRIAIEMTDRAVDPLLTRGMIDDIEDMDNIIGQFLTFVRDGTDEPDKPGNINKLITDIEERYARTNKPIKLNLKPIPDTEFKPVAMQRLLMNLIDNACYYGEKNVEVATLMSNGHIVIDVMDRGPGIPVEELEDLTKPFTRRYRARSNTDGAGLGLAIVKRVAQWHRGNIALLNRQGGGLIARVNLPCPIGKDSSFEK